jgi:sarcosine oxidase subunit delta
MLLIDCPFCGPRAETEFRCGGEAHIARPVDPSALDDVAWGAFLYMRSNTKGVLAERWNHAHGCGRWFNALRDTVSDRFLASYRSGEPRPDPVPAEAAR